jgi:hypothetical protein
LILVLLALLSWSAAGRADPPKEPDKQVARVKTTTRGVGGGQPLGGIVGTIDADGMTLVELRKFGEEPREHYLLPIDQLRAGEVVSALSTWAYRWQDVKPGDTVELDVAKDHIDKQRYVVEIRILKRPKGRLPASQKEDKDLYLTQLRLYHDIENGEDIEDVEIAVGFPPTVERWDRSGRFVPPTPGGLPREWQDKLDAIRAKKKEAELKAPPPEKKEK